MRDLVLVLAAVALRRVWTLRPLPPPPAARAEVELKPMGELLGRDEIDEAVLALRSPDEIVRAAAALERAAANGQWVVFVGHEVVSDPARRQTVTPETLRRLCDYCLDPAHGVWLDTVATVAERIRAGQASTSR